MTRPWQARISETAARNRSSRRAISARTASASIASTRRASSIAEAVASFGIMRESIAQGIHFSGMKNTSAHEALGLRFDRLSPAAYAALAFSLGALWLLGRRYGGFIHDASIYVLQGLRVLDPASFAGDLFFAYGAQDAYTVFPQIYSLLIGAFGAGSAA